MAIEPKLKKDITDLIAAEITALEKKLLDQLSETVDRLNALKEGMSDLRTDLDSLSRLKLPLPPATSNLVAGEGLVVTLPAQLGSIVDGRLASGPFEGVAESDVALLIEGGLLNRPNLDLGILRSGSPDEVTAHLAALKGSK